MIIKWSGKNGRYLIVELFHKNFLIKEEGNGSEVIEYTYTPFLRRKVEITPRGVRLIYNDFEEYKKACLISHPPRWVRKSQLVE